MWSRTHFYEDEMIPEILEKAPGEDLGGDLVFRVPEEVKEP